jgi:hypothetical protein
MTRLKTRFKSPPMSTGDGELGALGAVGAGEVGEDGEAALAATAGAAEPSPLVGAAVGAGDAFATWATEVGADGEPVGLSDALPGPPPRATAGAVTADVETFPIAPRAGPKSAALGAPPATAAPPTPGAEPVLAEVAVALPEPRVVFVGAVVSAAMPPRAAWAAWPPNNCCAKAAKLGPGSPSGETVTAPTGAAP